MQKPITGIILAGGKSIRMGQDKALIEIDGTPIILRILGVFRELFQESIIITNEKNIYLKIDVPVYRDLIPDRGALGGLYTGLSYSKFFHSFCVACDMPFLSAGVIEYLVSLIEEYDVVVPRTADGLQPLHAIYSKRCIDPIRQLLEHEKSKVIDLYPLVRVRIVDEAEFLFLDPEKESFWNVNTPEELRRVEAKRHRRSTC